MNNLFTLNWGARFPLQEVVTAGKVNPALDRVGGLYLWGFDASGREIVWYVGKTSNLKKRLIEHYFSLMSGQYQIPKGFLKGSFDELADVTSGWACDRWDPRVLDRLKDWVQMHDVFKGGHAFAHQAFARVAPMAGSSKDELGAAEHAAIYDLQPVVIKQCKSTPNQARVTHVVSPDEPDWLQGWRETHRALIRAGLA